MTRHYTAASLEAPDRLFQITQTSRTHTQLWLQADRPSIDEYRLEVLFPSVYYVSMPFVLRGLHLRRADPGQETHLAQQHDLEIDPEFGLFLLSPGKDWFVVSATPAWAESALNYNDESVFWRDVGEDVLISRGSLK